MLNDGKQRERDRLKRTEVKETTVGLVWFIIELKNV